MSIIKFQSLTFCLVWWTYFSAVSPHCYGYSLVSSYQRRVHIFVRDRLPVEVYQEKKKKEKKKINLYYTFASRYINDVLSPNNLKDSNCVDRSYPIELEIKNTMNTVRHDS